MLIKNKDCVIMCSYQGQSSPSSPVQDGTHQATICNNVLRRHVCTGLFLRKSLSPQHVAKKSNQTEFVRLVAATKFCCRDKFSPKNLLYTRSHLSMRCVAGTTCCCNNSPDLHTKSDLSPRLVAATHRLVCFDLYALLVTRAPEIFYSWFASTCQGVHIVDNTINNFLKSLRKNSISFPDGRRDVTCKLAIRQ